MQLVTGSAIFFYKFDSVDYNVGMGVNHTAIILKKIFRGAKNILINQLCWHGIWSELAFWKWRERIFSYDTIPSNDRNQFWQSFLWGAINSYQKNAVTKCKKKTNNNIDTMRSKPMGNDLVRVTQISLRIMNWYWHMTVMANWH